MRILATLVAAAAFALSAQAQAAEFEFEFKLHHRLPVKAPARTKMLEPWARQVEENSGGRVKIEIFPAMTLGGKPPVSIQQARDGVVDIVWTVNGYTPGLFPATEVFELPGVYRNDVRATNLAMCEMFDEPLSDEYKGVEVMWLHVHAGQAIMMVDAPARSPTDLAGKKMRIPTRTGAWLIETPGASPLATPVSEVPQALSTKTIDGTLLRWEIVPPLMLQNRINYFIEGRDKTRLGTTSFPVSMNKARWDGLPDDIKQAGRRRVRHRPGSQGGQGAHHPDRRRDQGVPGHAGTGGRPLDPGGQRQGPGRQGPGREGPRPDRQARIE